MRERVGFVGGGDFAETFAQEETDEETEDGIWYEALESKSVDALV